MSQPALPAPAHPEVDSMLSRRFGKEVANYFAGSPLNRLGFLRADNTFLSRAVKHPSTSFLLCNELQPLVEPNTPAGQGKLKFVKYEDVKPVIGEDPWAHPEADQVKAYNSEKYIPQMIFLGLDEKATNGGLEYEGKNLYKGTPYFAVDVTPRENVASSCELLLAAQKEKGFEISKGRMMDLEASHAAIYAAARQLLDWNARNPYCAGCGHKTMSVNAGFKRTCPSMDVANNASERPPCVTRKGVSNLSFPRTDPTVIMAILNHAGTHVLLGRQSRWPKYWYSTLAGFAEPAESIEEAVRRETYEESGVLVGRVVVHSTQPWPYPANLMIGAIGQAIPQGEKINLGNDPELEDAQWFSLDEVREALANGVSGLDEPAGSKYKEGGLRLPPSTAIANQLMTAVVNGVFTGANSKI
jgi:NAD+ diphosphatase